MVGNCAAVGAFRSRRNWALRFFWSGCDTVDGATLLHGGRSFAAAAVGVSVFFLTSRPLLGERFPFSAHDGYHHFYMADGQFTAIVAVCTAH